MMAISYVKVMYTPKQCKNPETVTACKCHARVTLRSYNFGVLNSTLFRRLSLWLISLLMGLLALGPFLHAHYGASLTSGFHINGLQAVTMAPTPGQATDGSVLSLPTEQDSPAVGVVTSLPRTEADAFTPDTTNVVLFSFLVLSILHRLPSAWPWNPVAPAAITRLFQAGCPPPAHAPPLSH